MNTRRFAAGISLLAIYTLAIPQSVAVDINWIGPTGVGANWNVGANWSTGLAPITPDVALINNGGIALIDSTMALNPGSVTLGSTAATSGVVIMSGGTLTLSNTDLRIGGNSTTVAGGTGLFDQSGGDIIMNAGNVNIGFNAVGTYNISAGSITLNASNIVAVGNRGTGTVNQSGGTVYVRGNSGATGTGFAAAVFQLGRNTATVPASGSYTLSGGTLAVTNFRFGNAAATSGVSNNTFNLQGSGELIARDVSVANTFATNTFNFTGGTLRAQTIGISVTNTGGILSPSNPLFNGVGDFSQLVIDPISSTIFGLDYGYTQSGNGRLSLDLRDALQYDILDVGGNGNGAVSLGGFIDVNPLSGFDPGMGSFFDVVKADSLTFTGQILGQTPSGNLFQSSVVTGGDGRQVLRLTVVPEPGSIALFGAAAFVVAGIRRRRRHSFE